MFNLLYTIDPDLVVNKVIESNNERKLIAKEIEGEYIKIKSNLLEEIKDLELLPKTRGRAVHLRKRSVNLEFKRKKKKEIRLFKNERYEEEKKNEEDKNDEE